MHKKIESYLRVSYELDTQEECLNICIIFLLLYYYIKWLR